MVELRELLDNLIDKIINGFLEEEIVKKGSSGIFNEDSFRSINREKIFRNIEESADLLISGFSLLKKNSERDVKYINEIDEIGGKLLELFEYFIDRLESKGVNYIFFILGVHKLNQEMLEDGREIFDSKKIRRLLFIDQEVVSYIFHVMNREKAENISRDTLGLMILITILFPEKDEEMYLQAASMAYQISEYHFARFFLEVLSHSPKPDPNVIPLLEGCCEKIRNAEQDV